MNDLDALDKVGVDQAMSLASEQSDEAFAARIARRDVAAFSSLYDRYARTVYALALHILGATDAEEIVQDVFLRLWTRAQQFDATQGSFAAWFMSIARHRILDELRRRGHHQRRVIAEEVGDMLAETADRSMDVEEQVSQHARAAAVLDALRGLPEEQRRVIVLAYFGGLSQTEMADLLALPLGTVKKRVRLGLQKLKAALLDQEHSIETAAGSDSAPTEY